MNYEGRRVLITGGLGFIGSNLAIRLVELGATVSVVDPLLGGCGGSLANLRIVGSRVEIIPHDIADPYRFRTAIEEAEIIFNLAGEISHIHSMQFPERDLQVNTVAQLRFLVACRELNRGVRIVYAGTRQVYGVPKYLPVDESHPVRPVDFNGIHKYAATMYHHMMARTGELDAVVLRLTNVYGPRMALNVVCQGFLSTFLRRVLLGQPLEIFGDGQQLRDPVYVRDVVEAFLLAGSALRPKYRDYNVGGPEALSLAAIARIMCYAGGLDDPTFRPFPPDRRAIDIGSYKTDVRRISRDFGWLPRVRFEDGIRETLAFYREHLLDYVDPNVPQPACGMPEHTGAPHRLTYAQR
jgi:UDP-glucose 4-epimerase